MAGSRTLKLSILADVDNLKKNLGEGSKEVEGFGGKLENFGKIAAAAFAAAAAAAVAYAGKLAIDGVKAAIEDEAAQNRLANALKNVTGATDAQIAAVEEQILKMSLANGIADDQLRPAFQRLAIATGDLTKAGDTLSLALDISAATGKSVEQVANALGKAYKGNTGALGRLGIGLSAAEIKTLGLDATMKQLSDTFGGAATVQANTLEGQIARLKVTFDEAKESVGAGLLPIVRSLLDYFVNTFIPKIIEVKDRALNPIIQAFKDNEGAMRTLWAFGKNYLLPFFENTLFAAIESVGKAIGGIINIVGFVMREVEKLVNAAISGINAVLNAYNAIPFLPNVNPISKISLSSAPSGSTGLGSRPLGGKMPSNSVPTISPSVSSGNNDGNVAVAAAANKAAQASAKLIQTTEPLRVSPFPNAQLGAEGDYLNAMTGQPINITVNGALDPSAVASQIKDILTNETTIAGNYSGGFGSSRFIQATV